MRNERLAGRLRRSVVSVVMTKNFQLGKRAKAAQEEEKTKSSSITPLPNA